MSYISGFQSVVLCSAESATLGNSTEMQIFMSFSRIIESKILRWYLAICILTSPPDNYVIYSSLRTTILYLIYLEFLDLGTFDILY